MKIASFDKFLLKQTAQLPNGEWRAVGIHASSEVDLVTVGGSVLSIGSLLPAKGSAPISAVRRSAGSFAPVGERLVLQLYEPCDELVPPAVRAPVCMKAEIDATGGGLPALAASPAIAIRLPFQGRQHATISFMRSDSALDMQCVVIGRRRPFYDNTGGDLLTQATPETWWNGGAAAPTDAFGNVCARTFHIGGVDNEECFDDLLICVRGAAGVDIVTVLAEAYGERIHP